MLDFNDDKKVQELLRKINQDIQRELSEKRYNHSIGVMKKAEELAKLYKVNINKAKLVGLAHDIGKELSKEDKEKYLKENNIEIDRIEKINVGLLHGKIGADICKKRYDFTEDMQDAIKFHTTGNKDMDLLAKIIFVADKIEEGRKYKDKNKMQELELIREAAKENLDEAMLGLIDSSLIYTMQKKNLIHPDSISTRNQLIINLEF